MFKENYKNVLKFKILVPSTHFEFDQLFKFS